MKAGVAMKREIIIEIEHVKRIRKRAPSQLRFCADCGSDADFISLTHAVELFERDQGELTNFLRVNGCHTQADKAETQICLAALLIAIETVSNNSKIRWIGEKK
jgi:hypothetical protein